MEMAKLELAHIENPNRSIDRYINDSILSKQGVTPTLTSKLNYEHWFYENETFGVKEFFDTQKSFLTNVFLSVKNCFQLYKKYQINVPSVGEVIPQNNFLKFCQEKKITPDLLSNAECNNV